jgi:hypothetical protein
MAELTVTRALAELKHLSNVIKKQTALVNFTTLLTKANRHQIVPEQFNKTCKADFQSLTDLLKRHDTLKSAIIASNATTKVTIGTETLTVAEVIERRQSLPIKKALLDRMRNQRDLVQRQFEAANVQMETELQRFLEVQFGNSSKTPEIEATSKQFRDSRRSEILDPLTIDAEISKLSEYIDNYDKEANLVLSESNAVTKLKLK